MSDIASSPLAAEKKRQTAKDGLNFDLESMQIEIETLKKEVAQLKGENSEIEALKEEVAQLKGQNSELEKKLEEKKVVWRLCSKHERNVKAIGCSTDEDRKMCPYYLTTIEDVMKKIPNAAETIFRYLDLKSAMTCRRVNKSWQSFVDHIYVSNLHVAVGAGDTEWVKALVVEGADVNAKLKIGKGYSFSFHYKHNNQTPLHIAATSSLPHHVEIGKLLIESGADLEAFDSSEDTPLVIAAENGGQHSSDFMKLLIGAGADIEGSADKQKEKSKRIKTPLRAAIENIGKINSAIDNIKILLDAGASPSPRPTSRASYYYAPLMGSLLVHLIQLAVYKGTEAMIDNLKVIDMFLDAGAKKWETNNDYLTPIQYAVQMTLKISKVVVGSSKQGLVQSEEHVVGQKSQQSSCETAIKKLTEYYNFLPGGPEPKSLNYDSWESWAGSEQWH